ncbi:type II secretion system protein GspH [Burkholderia sp. WAC0059]|uniref:GspH/FimT family pseudopilin n=1 Tax=Burkholderia sp. WAC0059 TaxID=2066022 RepID=UPI000C7F14DA|nr:GspH/FimT family pseudopilin [Burkholderia sp. WAC0059]PLZ00180.1 type II secretion system protein GspH [Burkholderia sp. WAC0059]
MQMKSGWGRQSPCRGVTLIETLVVVVLLSLCAMAATPSWFAWSVRDQVEGRANALLGTLAYARNEAIRQRVRITVCRIDAARRCLAAGKVCPSGASDWSCGWAVMAGGSGAQRLLRFQSGFDGISVISPLSSIAFTPPAGRAAGTFGSFEIAPRKTTAATSGARWRRCIRIASAGRARMTEGACVSAS